MGTSKASMGPRLFRRGNFGVGSYTVPTPPASMGPRLSDVEIAVRAARKRAQWGASMGPRLFRRGNKHRRRNLYAGGTSLQWGQRLFRRGNAIINTSNESVCWLQWGHVFSDVEIEYCSSIVVAQSTEASMGPRLFRRGNSRLPVLS